MSLFSFILICLLLAAIAFFVGYVLWASWIPKAFYKNRRKLLNELERKRGTRVITLIHKDAKNNKFVNMINKFINIEDSLNILNAIRTVPKDIPIDLIIHTPGGIVLPASQIAQALMRHKSRVTVFIPHYAMSGGTLLALAADEVIMDPNAVLGPVDPQISGYPAASLVKLKKEQKNKTEAHFSVLADVAEKAIKQMAELVFSMLKVRQCKDLPITKTKAISKQLTHGMWTHDYPLTPEILHNLGLNVKVGLPHEVYHFMDNIIDSTPNVEFVVPKL